MFLRQLSRRVGASAWARGRSGGPRGGPRASSALNACARAPAAFSTSGAFGKLTRRELQQLAKAHSVRANMKSVEIVAALEDLGVKPPTSSPEPPAFESAPSKTSAHQPGAATSKFSWPPREEDDAIDMSDATDWLAPADLEPANRRVIKPSSLPNLTTTATADNDDDDSGASRSYMVSDLDPDVADYISQPQPSGGLEAQPDKLVPHDGTIVEGQTSHLITSQDSRAEQRKRYFCVSRAYQFGRMDAEHYIIATGPACATCTRSKMPLSMQ